MTRTATSLIALSFFALPAFAETQDFSAGTFDTVDVAGGIEVVYEQGATHSVIVEQSKGDFSDIDIDTNNNELVIRRVSLQKKSGWRRNLSINSKNGEMVVKVNGKVKPNYIVRVTSPTIRELDASQSAVLTATNINTDDLELDASSSATLVVSGRSGATEIDVSSSADIDAANLVTTALTVDASSSADLSATSEGAGAVFIGISSSADATLTLTGASDIEIDASSSADLVLAGTCSSITVDASSSADIGAGDLTCSSANVSASSSADVIVHATQSVDASASSGADVEVFGEPPVRDVRKSSGGDISFAS